MGKVISITSGKGGVGKSSICVFLARAFAQQGKKVVIIEMDCGLRGLDIMLGVDQSVYDLGDILNGRCQVANAICVVPDCDRLFLVAAPAVFERFPTAQELEKLCSCLNKTFDYILIDTSAGYGLTKTIASVSDTILLVATPDPVCVRDAGIVSNLLRKIGNAELRLIINKVSKTTLKKDMMPDLDAVIDGVGVQLVGVVPETQELWHNSAKGLPLDAKNQPAKIFDAIATRITGQQVPLIVRHSNLKKD